MIHVDYDMRLLPFIVSLVAIIVSIAGVLIRMECDTDKCQKAGNTMISFAYIMIHDDALYK